jgi:succinate dehydrogenase flavin-adding protein (antitoxin of CptAB toxin-antitoxin module)/predicted RNA-binding Zn-ribbon protein involved in translation (DUF1610 family)
MKLTLDRLLELLPQARLDHRGKNLTGTCPVCGEAEFGISLEDGHRFGCYRLNKCGFRGNIFTLLKFLGKLDEVLQEKIKNLPERISTTLPIITQQDLHIDDCPPPIGWRAVSSLPYLDERGFREQDYTHYPVGITKLDPRLKNHYVVFLALQDSAIKGWVARRTQTKSEIEQINRIRLQNKQPPIARYLNSFSDFGKMCYGIDELSERTNTLIIVEGIFDKINVDRLMNLHCNFETKCIATYKATISHEQIYTIANKAPNIVQVVLLYDSDVIRLIKESIATLQKHYSVLVGYHATKDPGDMNEDDLTKVLQTLEHPIEFKSFKLEASKL